MKLQNGYKLIAILFAMAASIIGAAINAIDKNVAENLMFALVFYVVGNGVAAKRQTPAEPVIAPKDAV